VLVIVGVLAVLVSGQIVSLAKQRADLRQTLAKEILELIDIETRQSKLEARLIEKQAKLTQMEAALAEIQRLAPAATQKAVDTAALKPRVYVQAASPATDELARHLEAPLRESGFLVPPPERVKSSPRKPQIRYFRDDDLAAAQLLFAIVQRMVPQVTLVPVKNLDTTRIRPGHLELWM
jgi:hypothetical protein